MASSAQAPLILDDDSQFLSNILPIATLSIDPTVVYEAGQEFTLTVNLSQPAPTNGLRFSIFQQDVDRAFGDISPLPQLTNAVDFTSFGTVEPEGFAFTIVEGATEAKISFEPLLDALAEGNELTTYTLLPGAGYTLDPTNSIDTITIRDLPLASLSIDQRVVTEGDQYTLTINLDQPATVGGLRVKLSQRDSDRTLGDIALPPQLSNIVDFVDFSTTQPTGFTFTIVEGATQATLTYTTLRDAELEGDELTTYQLLPNAGYRLKPNSFISTVTIQDPPTASISIDQNTVMEGEQYTLTLNLDRPAPANGLRVRLSQRDVDQAFGDLAFPPQLVNARNFERFGTTQPIGAVFTVVPGATAAKLIFTTLKDANVEGDELTTFQLLPDAGYRLKPNSFIATATIQDLPVVSISATPTQVAEGTQLSWNFSLSQPAPANGVTIQLALTENTDPLPGDILYNVAGGSNITGFELLTNETGGITGAQVSFAAGATTATLVSDVIADSRTEGLEKITFSLVEGTAYAVHPATNKASFTILDTSIQNPFLVTSRADTIDPTDGSTTLREAIDAANRQSGINLITFELAAGSQINLTDSLEITDDIFLAGDGITIAGDGSFDNVWIHNTSVVIDGLSIINGLSGIQVNNDSNLVLFNSKLTGHSGNAISFNGTDNLATMNNVYLKHNAGNGIAVSGSNHILMANEISIANNGGNGIRVAATNGLFAFNDASINDNGSNGVLLDNLSNDNLLTLVDTSFSNNGGVAFLDEGSDNTVIAPNPSGLSALALDLITSDPFKTQVLPAIFADLTQPIC